MDFLEFPQFVFPFWLGDRGYALVPFRYTTPDTLNVSPLSALSCTETRRESLHFHTAGGRSPGPVIVRLLSLFQCA